MMEEFCRSATLDGLPACTVNLEGLLRTKQTLRDKDAADRVVLEQALAKLRKMQDK